MNEAKYAYIAGLIDGEGTIGIRRYNNSTGQLHYRPVVEINNTSKEMIDFVVQTLGFSSYRERKYYRKKDQWVWRAHGKKCIPTLEVLIPYLITKKERAILCIEFCRRLTTRGYSWTEEFRATENAIRHEYYLKFKTLNS